jgi:hypothetical protein
MADYKIKANMDCPDTGEGGIFSGMIELDGVTYGWYRDAAGHERHKLMLYRERRETDKPGKGGVRFPFSRRKDAKAIRDAVWNAINALEQAVEDEAHGHGGLIGFTALVNAHERSKSTADRER